MTGGRREARAAELLHGFRELPTSPKLPTMRRGVS